MGGTMMRTRVGQVSCGSLLRRLGLMAAGCIVLVAISGAQSKPEKLQCESLTEPLGMDTEHPILSWQLRDPRDGARQTAYQIEVASSPQNLTTGKADIWDSGKVESDNSRGV